MKKVLLGVVFAVLVSTSAWALVFRPPLAVQWGGPGDLPVKGDFDADGRQDIAVFRDSTGDWFLLLSREEWALPGHVVVWGQAGDVPMPGDYDGDTIDDIAVYRPSTGVWHVRFSNDRKQPD